jgi:hypothetical protein
MKPTKVTKRVVPSKLVLTDKVINKKISEIDKKLAKDNVTFMDQLVGEPSKQALKQLEAHKLAQERKNLINVKASHNVDRQISENKAKRSKIRAGAA